MSIKALMSAAHAAGFAMAAEEVAESPPAIEAKPVRPAVPARIPRSLPAPIPLEVLKAQRTLRRFWLRLWLAGVWGGRAAA